MHHFIPLSETHDACYKSSYFAIGLAQKYNTRLHVLHITTAIETALFDNTRPLRDKRITSEACVHHLWFDAGDYARLGNKIKCNPAIKEKKNKEAVLAALLDQSDRHHSDRSCSAHGRRESQTISIGPRRSAPDTAHAQRNAGTASSGQVHWRK
jgi:dihydroorotase-like cyclic amidohydrolase